MPAPRSTHRPQGRWRAALPAAGLLFLAAAAEAQPQVVRPAPTRPEVVRPSAVQRATDQRVLPLDPLTERERELAVRLATADERVRRLTAGREWDVGYVEVLIVKGTRPGPDTPDRPDVASRRAEVLIAAFDREFTAIRVVVDLDSARVREAVGHAPRERLAEGREPVGFAVPFTPRERALAREIALGNAEIRSALGARLDGWEAEGLPITQVIPDVCPSGRCMEMIFFRGDTYLTSTVIVDIPTRSSRFRRGPQ